MSARADYSDLLPRILSGIALVVICLGALLIGGDVWGVFLVVAAGLMGWELSRMHSPQVLVQVLFGLLLAAAVLSWLFLSPVWSAVIAALIVATAFASHLAPVRVIGWALAIGIGTAVLQIVRESWGVGWELWLVLCVVASDIGGYFVGKTFGGPKIAPVLSPNKTWSGTIGGWALAALVGAGAWLWGLDGPEIIPWSVSVAIAAQLGDVLESRVKRKAQVKDSSRLIPGHGGLLDRFDGVIGAAVFMALVLVITES